MAEKIKRENVMTPVGRLINNSLFEKDVFKDPQGREGTPSYKIEMTFPDELLGLLEEKVVEAAIAKWGPEGEKMYDDGRLESPFKNGDDLAAKREAKGKSGDAYRGLTVIRASTVFNKNGDDAPGGVYVCDENAVEIAFSDRGKVYNGCYGVAVVTPVAYDAVGNGKPGVTLYLQGFQFTKDGERLRGNVSSLFSPMMGAGSEDKGRRRRS